jgi:hypothetical protein
MHVSIVSDSQYREIVDRLCLPGTGAPYDFIHTVYVFYHHDRKYATKKIVANNRKENVDEQQGRKRKKDSPMEGQKSKKIP